MYGDSDRIDKCELRIDAIELALAKAPLICAVELLRPKPGDVLVLTIDKNVNAAQRSQIGKSFKECCRGIEVAVIPDHWKVQVVRKEDVPQEPPPSLDMGVEIVR